MRPAARVQAAIDVLAAVLNGAPAERELTTWGRNNRYAGSKDRAAVRDLVFDALRRLRSSAWIAGQGDCAIGAMDARDVLAGLLSAQGEDLGLLFDGSQHGPAPLSGFTPTQLSDAPLGVRLDLPDWLLNRFQAAYPNDLDAIAEALRHRAPVHLRVNTAKATRPDLIASLTVSGFEPTPHPLSPTAIELKGKVRGLPNEATYLDGVFEMQDAGSQALVDRVPLKPGLRVLDLCAGGGGKSLALAARHDCSIDAFDADAGRLRNLATRATRAGAEITIVETPENRAPYDVVICDVPCSGSGAWRRQAEARWRLTSERLGELQALQQSILRRAADLVSAGGSIAYMTCSLFPAENDGIADWAMRELDLDERLRWSCTPLDGADGFFVSVLAKKL